MIEQLIRTYTAGETVYAEGDRGREAFYVLDGRLMVNQASSGNPEVVGSHETGDLFGVGGLLSGQARSATITCDTDVRLEVFDANRIAELLRSEPDRIGPVVASMFDRMGRSRMNPTPAPTALAEAGNETQSDSGNRLVITPLTPRARAALGADQTIISTFPCTIGRNDDPNASHSMTNGKLVLQDDKPFFISRDHVVVESTDSGLVIFDRTSSLGTIVDGKAIGRKADKDSAKLKRPKSHVILGGAHSPYEFEFRS